MYRNKEFDKRYLKVIIILIISLLLVILSVALKKDRNLNSVEKIAKDTGSFVINILGTPVDFISNKIAETKEKNDIYNKYKELKSKEEQTESLIAETNNLKQEIKSLKAALDLNTTLSDKVYKNATVINRNIDYWYDEVTIDKGKTNGIEKNMAVVNNNGLIGTVTKVSNHVSTVKLLSSKSLSDKISVKINVGDTYVYGLISKYNFKKNTYTVEGISENIEIPKGAEVVTTGMGDTFPSGLLLGHVKKISTDNFDLSKVAVVTSSVDFDNIEYVAVLKRVEK
mgnify:FL=1